MTTPKVEITKRQVILTFKDQEDAIEVFAKFHAVISLLLKGQEMERETIQEGQTLTEQSGRNVTLRFHDSTVAKSNFDSLNQLFTNAFKNGILPDGVFSLLASKPETETGLEFQSRMKAQLRPSGTA